MEAGYSKPVGSPLSLKREFANRSHLPRFLAGSFGRENDEYVVDIDLYATESGRLLTEHRYRGTSISALVDTMSVQLRRDLGIPEYHIDQNPDLPVAEMFTPSLQALEHYVNGVNSIWQDNDYERAVSELIQAVTIDPAFAMAYWLLWGAYIELNRGEQAREAMNQALKHKYRLPENQQYKLKNDYYELREDPEAWLENARRWAALHPAAAGAHETLAEHYERVNDFEAAIGERKILFEIDPQRYSELHAIGALYENLGDDDKALDYYEEYAELHPDKHESYTTLGWFHWRRGDYNDARYYYKKALLVDPDRVSIRTNLAGIERHMGNFAASLEQCEEALASARSSSDSSTALWRLTEYYKFRGQAKKGLECQISAMDKMRRTESPATVMIVQLFTLDSYVDAGRFDEAIAIARSIEEQAAVSIIKSMVSIGYVISYATYEDPSFLPEVEKHTQQFERWVTLSGRENLQWALEFCKSLVAYWRDDKQAALDHVKNALERATPDEVNNRSRMLLAAAEISREMEDYDEAFRFLEKLFELEPFSPEGHLEAARIYHAQGQTQEAIDHLKKALHVWENADPEHPRAKRARELAEQLRLSS
jgi:tetratricopeptide (TPR) repeat protein